MKRKGFFKRHIHDFFKSSIAEGKKILIVSYGEKGELISLLKPSLGIELVDSNSQAKCEAPLNVTFVNANFLDYETDIVFDYIIFQEYLNYEDNLYDVFYKIKSLTNRDSKIFIFGINPHSSFVIRLLKHIGILTPKIERNILHLEDIENLLNICGMEVLNSGYKFLCPFRLLGFGDFLNALVCRIPLLRLMYFGQFVVFRPHPSNYEDKKLSASVVIPCYNEEGNIRKCIESIPQFGLWREIIVVDDGSKDRTAEIVRKIAQKRDDVKLITYQENRGKGYAVNEGWKNSKGDVLMMLDSDMTTPPQELPLFHKVMESGAEFINGTRVVYPREKKSIPFLNRIGVVFFARLISWITGKRISDTFCGTKVLLKKYWPCFKIEEFLWGDWDLFFTAAQYRMKMVEVPVHYKARKAGISKMKPLKHGIALLKTSIKGLKMIK